MTTPRDEILEPVPEEPNAATEQLRQQWDGLPDRDEAWLPVEPMDGCTFSGYESSDKGRYRSIDRVSSGRQLRGKVLSTRLDDGYVLVNIRCDSIDPEHNRVHTFLAHKVTLTTWAGPCPPGMEARHSDRGPAFNWWPEGFKPGGWGTKRENHDDQVAAGTATTPEPSFPCRNAPTCTNVNRAEGKRCRACVVQLGVDAAAMLNDGTPLAEVAAHFRVSNQWAFRLAGEYGGYEGTPEQARAEHRPCQCADCIAGGNLPQPIAPQQVTFRAWLRSVMYRKG